MEKQKDKYDEGEEVTTKTLMQVTLIKFKDRKRSDKWQAPTMVEEQIIALTAQLGDLQKAKSTNATPEKSKKTGTKKGTGDSAKTKVKADRYAEKYAWKLIPPACGEPTTKEVGSKTYHFCPHHNNGAGAWVIHLPSKCDNREGKKDKPATDKVMSLTKALQAIQEAGDTSESDDEDE